MTAVVKAELPARVSDSSALMKIIEKASMDPQFDVAKLEKLLDMRERWERDEARKAYNEAFAQFKAEAITIIKNREVTAGPLSGKKYAELFSVVNAVTPALSRYGLSHSWKIADEKDMISVTCTLRHVLGHSESVTMTAPPDTGGAKNAIQARASALTYLERYTLKAVCGIAEQGDDTDGNGGMDVDTYASYLKAIDEAKTVDELFSEFKAAYKAAESSEDKGAMKRFIERKDARKKALGA